MTSQEGKLGLGQLNIDLSALHKLLPVILQQEFLC